MWKKSGFLAMAVLACVVIVQAQERQPRQQPAREGNQNQRDERLATRDDARQLDGIVADCILLGTQEEIAVAQLAASKSQNPEVKQFAQMMVRDHQQSAEKLRKFALHDVGTLTPSRGVAATDRGTADPANREGRPSRDARAEQPGRVERQAGFAAGSLNEELYQIERKAAQECLRLTQECLNKEQGEDFDKAFIGQQIGMHIGMLAKLTASEQHVSPELRQVVREGIQSCQKHKDQAEQLMKNLASNAPRSRAQQ
jgi:predicted outer membrane protein